MPETSMHEYDCTITGKYDVWLSRKISNMNPESEPFSMEEFPDSDFRDGVLPPDSGHHPAAGQRIDDVSHWIMRSDDEWKGILSVFLTGLQCGVP